VSRHSEQRLGVNKGLNTRLQFNRQIARLKRERARCRGETCPRSGLSSSRLSRFCSQHHPSRPRRGTPPHASRARIEWEDIPREHAGKCKRTSVDAYGLARANSRRRAVYSDRPRPSSMSARDPIATAGTSPPSFTRNRCAEFHRFRNRCLSSLSLCHSEWRLSGKQFAEEMSLDAIRSGAVAIGPSQQQCRPMSAMPPKAKPSRIWLRANERHT
jgi:hypothetical protein